MSLFEGVNAVLISQLALLAWGMVYAVLDLIAGRRVRA